MKIRRQTGKSPDYSPDDLGNDTLGHGKWSFNVCENTNGDLIQNLNMISQFSQDQKNTELRYK